MSADQLVASVVMSADQLVVMLAEMTGYLMVYWLDAKKASMSVDCLAGQSELQCRKV